MMPPRPQPQAALAACPQDTPGLICIFRRACGSSAMLDHHPASVLLGGAVCLATVMSQQTVGRARRCVQSAGSTAVVAQACSR